MLITLPLPISANRYWRHWNNRVVISEEARAYREEVAWMARKAQVPLLSGPVRMHVTFHPMQPKDWVKRERKSPRLWQLDVRRIDLGNVDKVLSDALQGIAFEDDKQITDLRVRLGEAVEGGAVSVEISPDPNWSNPQ